MTGHTSDETLDLPQEERSTDSSSATKFPERRSGVVQDGPGNPEIGTADEQGGLLDDQGDYRSDDNTL
ncbi:hypothetical protein ACFP81_01030 [Deinococcus lacus]|uniref:MatE family transporter n=1 Tax=Deinococcus lacus TaxID=392561 RepID=A0ABW1Y8Y3_9DEIO